MSIILARLRSATRSSSRAWPTVDSSLVSSLHNSLRPRPNESRSLRAANEISLSALRQLQLLILQRRQVIYQLLQPLFPIVQALSHIRGLVSKGLESRARGIKLCVKLLGVLGLCVLEGFELLDLVVEEFISGGDCCELGNAALLRIERLEASCLIIKADTVCQNTLLNAANAKQLAVSSPPFLL